MSLIYITGMPSSGKSSVRQALQRKGFLAYGGAEDRLAAFFNNDTGEKIDWLDSSARTPEWNKRHTWKIPRKIIEEIKQSSEGKPAFLCAITRNDRDELWDLFDKVIALIIDEDTLKHRLATRTNNDVGKTEHELEVLIERQKTAKADYERLGAHLVDATQPIDRVVEAIVKIATA